MKLATRRPESYAETSHVQSKSEVGPETQFPVGQVTVPMRCYPNTWDTPRRTWPYQRPMMKDIKKRSGSLCASTALASQKEA
ncbi:hypothetical protein E2C01_001461 [Portunus trituberculatus]|uniref:Uncharacterized protein n=1 Tax=Portunus trituberculatus TaxID=210409 RepID=A0A5B7CH86_PORTR|nr:hypothetical protein [Portunus trituberculatus]